MNVKGLKITDILDIDLDTFNNLNEKELRALTSRLVSAGNKRIRRLEKHDINSPAMQSLGNEKVFSTNGGAALSALFRGLCIHHPLRTVLYPPYRDLVYDGGAHAAYQ